MKIIEKNIQTFGLEIELTNSQSDNFFIIQNHWKLFNQELKKYNLIQKDGSWEKFGITYKKAEKYFYLTAIPKFEQVFPDHFLHKEIPKGAYEIFTHKGNMQSIKETFYIIYKNILPNSTLTIEIHNKTGFIHFEKYDYRFQWNKPNSIIDIYLPLKTDFE